MSRVELCRVNDEQVDLIIDGRYIMSADHDRYGWSGMNLFEDTVKVMAQFLGAELEETEGEEC